MTHVSNPNGFYQEPSFKNSSSWHLVPCLLLLTCLAAYFSFSWQVLDKERNLLATLTQEVASINSDHSAVADGFGRWLVRVQRIVPSITLHAAASASALIDPLNDLTHRIENAEAVKPIDQYRLRQELVLTEVALRQAQQQLNTALVRQDLYLKLCLFGFFGLVGLALVGRAKRGAKSTMQALLADEYLFSNVPVGVSISDGSDRLIRVNRSYEKVTGFSEEELIGGVACEREPEGMRAALQEKGSWTGDQTIWRKDGATITEKMMRVAIGSNSEKPEGYLSISMDPIVSDDERQLMLWQAHHDSLTKLPNANLLHERLVRGLSTAQVEERLGALISVDIDSFQQVNDSMGHELADRILTDAAYRIALCARESDTVARTGSDHFVMALLEIENVGQAEQIARAAVKSMAAPFFAGDQEIFLTASAGITIFPEDGLDRGELLQKADAARMQAKKRGGGQIAFFEAQMNSDAARRLEIELHLRRAIEKDELEIYYQPIIACQSGRVYGAEALLRWHSDALGFVSPGEFIPVAEQCGLIVEVGEWVVKTVSMQICKWTERADWQNIRVSLNVSARQFMTEEHALELLALFKGAAAEWMTVELTESALIVDDPGASVFLTGIKEYGLRVALDDFGTGYSSIGYLKDFDFDVLKIDKSFIDGIASSKEMGVIASIIAMGRILGMKIVAEGVEDEEQFASLKQIGCDYIQGYYFSKPLPLAEFEAFVQDHA